MRNSFKTLVNINTATNENFKSKGIDETFNISRCNGINTVHNNKDNIEFSGNLSECMAFFRGANSTINKCQSNNQ